MSLFSDNMLTRTFEELCL